MANRMKEKGMIEERAVEKIVHTRFPDAKRTRAGRMEDEGDILVPSVNASIQVKDVRTPNWSEWLSDLADQKRHSGASTAFLSVKRSRPGKSPLRLAVMPLEDMLDLIERAK